MTTLMIQAVHQQVGLETQIVLNIHCGFLLIHLMVNKGSSTILTGTGPLDNISLHCFTKGYLLFFWNIH